jgi:hypothetical protein
VVDEETKPKRKAKDNPRYRLATLHGEPSKSDDEITRKNRVTGNRWMAARISDVRSAPLRPTSSSMPPRRLGSRRSASIRLACPRADRFRQRSIIPVYSRRTSGRRHSFPHGGPSFRSSRSTIHRTARLVLAQETNAYVVLPESTGRGLTSATEPSRRTLDLREGHENDEAHRNRRGTYGRNQHNSSHTIFRRVDYMSSILALEVDVQI